MIDTSDITIYVACGSIELAFAYILLKIDVAKSSKSLPYLRIKQILAFNAFLSCICNYAYIGCAITHTESHLLDDYVWMVLYYLQLILTTSAALGLIHSKYLSPKILKILSIPPLLYIVLSVLLYYQTTKSGHSSTAASILYYLQWSYEGILTVLSIGCILLLIKEMKAYGNRLDNFFADKIPLSLGSYTLIIGLTISYYILALVETIANYPPISRFCIVAEALVFIVSSITIINLQKSYLIAGQSNELNESDAIELKDGQTPTLFLNLPTEQGAFNHSPQATVLNKKSISILIEQWVQRYDKPYLKEGITLHDVANALHVSPRTLSIYINNIYNKTFNSWINYMRIQEAKRLIVEHPSESITDISIQTGFTDQSSLTKIFKHFEGVTPSTYRATHH